jgi:hypothetical protein
MPRLVGKQSSGGWYAGLFVVAAIASVVAIEYLGFINEIPGFGKDRKVTYQSRFSIPEISSILDPEESIH